MASFPGSMYFRNAAFTINPVIYTELSVAYARIEELEAMIAQADFVVAPIPREALFLAGKVFKNYRRRGGATGVLPDFFIGAHAAVTGVPLLTRDMTRYRARFPNLVLVSP